MKSKLFVSALIIVGATGVACKKTVVSNGGSGGTGTTTTVTSTHSTGTANTTTTHATTGTNTTVTTTTTGGGNACDSIGVCQDPTNMGDPTKGCFDCSLTQGTMFSDEGACIPQATAAYGSDGKCTMGGVPGACAYLTCENMCFMNDPTGQQQATWDCFCANDKMGANSSCLPQAMQMGTNTCVGKLVADSAALTAEANFETCAFKTTCANSCAQAGG